MRPSLRNIPLGGGAMKAQHGHETKVLIKLECISQLLHILRENFQAIDTSSPGSTKVCNLHTQASTGKKRTEQRV